MRSCHGTAVLPIGLAAHGLSGIGRSRIQARRRSAGRDGSKREMGHCNTSDGVEVSRGLCARTNALRGRSARQRGATAAGPQRNDGGYVPRGEQWVVPAPRTSNQQPEAQRRHGHSGSGKSQALQADRIARPALIGVGGRGTRIALQMHMNMRQRVNSATGLPEEQEEAE